ncbi:DUF6792 domain-containing protein [Salipaludibacillus agaradhaerens]|uniref:DUF6792 domain-containing protein n=1 Tax=Salipaludibacillus agaradhaerens TaxID=76935 RepID=UPI0009977A6C|nr:DUF6792 domain-containing protein [Salipaludibacillus agaradhaerens]
MTEAEDILSTDEIRARVTDLEYKNLSEEEFIKEIERIYIEEKGEALPAKVEYFHSSDVESLKDDTSGYDGTALYFHSEENQIDVLYTISQGSQDTLDWEYNAIGLFGGTTIKQAEATAHFESEARRRFGIENDQDVLSIGLSHSLANNNNSIAHLTFGTFDVVHSFNGAQVSAYQMYF